MYPSGTLLLDATLEEDFAELLLDFAKLLLDTLVSLSLDFASELLESSQSSQADEESTLGRVAKSLLSSSPQATSTTATIPAIKNFFKAINYTPTKQV